MTFDLSGVKEGLRTLKAFFKREKRLLEIIITIFLLLIMIGCIFWLNQPLDKVPTSASQVIFEKAEVTAVLSDNATVDYINAEGLRIGTQELEIRVISGKYKNEIMTLTNHMSALFNVDLQKGDRIIIRILMDEDGNHYASLFNYDRGIIIGAFVLLFFGLLALLGGKKGIGALLGLIFTLICIWYVLIPCYIRGFSTIAVTVAMIGLTTTVALILLNGFSLKTLCSILGCVMGVIVAASLAAIVGSITPMSGFNMPEAENLILYGAEKGMKIKGLMVCGVLISALGAVMDVSLGITSSMWEIHQHNPKLTLKQFFHAGMRIGKDAMGTMANTLILAFAGSSLNMLILVQTYDIPFLQLINTDYMCIEIIQSIAGAMGILLTVPIVAFLCSYFMTKKSAVR